MAGREAVPWLPRVRGWSSDGITPISGIISLGMVLTISSSNRLLDQRNEKSRLFAERKRNAMALCCNRRFRE